MKKMLIMVTFLFSFTKPVYAAQEICTPVYGGGVVCGARVEEPHKPVNANIGGIALLAGGLLVSLSLGLNYFSRKKLKNSFYINWPKKRGEKL